MRDTIELHRISEKFYQSYCGKISENLPQCTLDASRWQIPDGVDLADPPFAENHPIDILIGADTFWKLVMPGKSYSKPHGTIIQETKLGWIISGVRPNNKRAHFNCNTVSILQKQIEKFWEIESFDNKIPLFEEDRYSKKTAFPKKISKRHLKERSR
jgi:hypothetical protein